MRLTCQSAVVNQRTVCYHWHINTIGNPVNFEFHFLRVLAEADSACGFDRHTCLTAFAYWRFTQEKEITGHAQC